MASKMKNGSAERALRSWQIDPIQRVILMKPILFFILLMAATPMAHATSFDCRKAVTIDEKAVCADPRLSDLDTLLGRAFAEANKSSATDKDDSAKVMAVARVFLKQRQACGATRSCLIGSYVGALDGYTNTDSTVAIPSWVDAPAIAGDTPLSSRALPTAPGQCVSTKVADVHPRLGGDGPVKDEDYDSGTGVEFTNGGHQVSYSREQALLGSRKGDPAIMCLISIPQLCPPGDERGRSYTEKWPAWSDRISGILSGGPAVLSSFADVGFHARRPEAD